MAVKRVQTSKMSSLTALPVYFYKKSLRQKTGGFTVDARLLVSVL